MSGLFVMLSLGFAILIIVSIVSPVKGLFWAKFVKNKTMGKAVALNFIALIVALYCVGATVPAAKETKTEKTETVSTETPIVQEANTIVDEKAYISEAILPKLKKGIDKEMTYKEFLKIVKKEGKIVFDRDGTKTYAFYKKEKPNEEIRIVFDNGKLLAVSDTTELTKEIDNSKKDTSNESQRTETSDNTNTTEPSKSSGGFFDNIKDKVKNVAYKNNNYVLGVKNSSPEDYPKKSYGEAFEKFFGDPSWSVFEADNGQKVVEFKGHCIYENVNVKARLQFIISKDEKTFEIGALSFNDVPQSEFITGSLILKAFSD